MMYFSLMSWSSLCLGLFSLLASLSNGDGDRDIPYYIIGTEIDLTYTPFKNNTNVLLNLAYRDLQGAYQTWYIGKFPNNGNILTIPHINDTLEQVLIPQTTGYFFLIAEQTMAQYNYSGIAIYPAVQFESATAYTVLLGSSYYAVVQIQSEIVSSFVHGYNMTASLINVEGDMWTENVTLPFSVVPNAPTRMPSTQSPTTAVPTVAPPTTIPPTTAAPTPKPPTITPRPTAAPTSVPTSVPTPGPTSAPTPGPTSAPTSAPTSSPTRAPTLPTTARPTLPRPTTAQPTPPTRRPTKSPTGSPSPSPSQPPTRSPSESPTRKPTRKPTQSPTQSPTRSPTRSPTKPTQPPTRTPTKPTQPTQPTQLPTPKPTLRTRRLLQSATMHYVNATLKIEINKTIISAPYHLLVSISGLFKQPDGSITHMTFYNILGAPDLNTEILLYNSTHISLWMQNYTVKTTEPVQLMVDVNNPSLPLVVGLKPSGTEAVYPLGCMPPYRESDYNTFGWLTSGYPKSSYFPTGNYSIGVYWYPYPITTVDLPMYYLMSDVPRAVKIINGTMSPFIIHGISETSLAMGDEAELNLTTAFNTSTLLMYNFVQMKNKTIINTSPDTQFSYDSTKSFDLISVSVPDDGLSAEKDLTTYLNLTAYDCSDISLFTSWIQVNITSSSSGSSSSSSSGLGADAIAGIVIACVLIVAIASLWYWTRPKDNDYHKMPQDAE